MRTQYETNSNHYGKVMEARKKQNLPVGIQNPFLLRNAVTDEEKTVFGEPEMIRYNLLHKLPIILKNC